MHYFKLLWLALIFHSSVVLAQKKPNIVFILSDDVGWTGLSGYGSDYYETPNIDALAEKGVKFSNYYAPACVCAPARASYMSGQYSPRHGVYRVLDLQRPKGAKANIKDYTSKVNVSTVNLKDYKAIQPEKKPFAKEIITMAEALKTEGYATATFGKWHLDPHKPDVQGFDEWSVAGKTHFSIKPVPDENVDKDVYLTDFMADKAIKFIEKNKDKPFFLYLPDYLVHKPHEAKQALIEKYKKKGGKGFHKNAIYGAMTESLDETVGRVIGTLERLNLMENTLIVFTSDNGANCNFDEKTMKPKKNAFTDNIPLRSGKGFMYEGGLRVPMIVYWKGHTAVNKVVDTPAIGVDLYPTFLEVAGAKTPNQPLDGVSLLKQFTKPNSKMKERSLFWHYPNYGRASRRKTGIKYSYMPTDVIRKGDYKLLEFYELNTVKLELYNLKDDISETTNLVESKPELAKAMHEELKAWRKRLNAEEMKPNPDFVPVGKVK